MSKFEFPWYLVIVAGILGALGTAAYFGSKEGDKRQAEAEQSWAVWHAEVLRAGCKVDTYIATDRNYYTRPIWRCPDGRVLLGRPQ
jgi:hypothetical protein